MAPALHVSPGEDVRRAPAGNLWDPACPTSPERLTAPHPADPAPGTPSVTSPPQSLLPLLRPCVSPRGGLKGEPSGFPRLLGTGGAGQVAPVRASLFASVTFPVTEGREGSNSAPALGSSPVPSVETGEPGGLGPQGGSSAALGSPGRRPPPLPRQGVWGAPPLPTPLGEFTPTPRSSPRFLSQQQLFYSSIKTGYTIGYSLSLASLLIATAILSLFR